ncbi:restriction endonuclease subunit R [Verrucomicrobia bacterium S94]|nr:restriction endonuclease subunit R [Verrucomicrobia bacterium S94]
MASRKRGSKKVKARFDQRLVLFNWMLRLFEVADFHRFAQELNDSRFEGVDAEGRSHFYYNLRSLVGRIALSNEQLETYDANIVRHWKRISEKRNREAGQPLYPKYFQYLSLLFTEIYLDRWFTDKEQLLAELNEFLETFNARPELLDAPAIEPFTLEEMNKLAFWCATGSGKTLLLHVNLLQYQHYLKKHRKQKKLNRVILLTPNEGLSRQHLREFSLSNIQAEMFTGESRGLFAGHNIEIIDIHKLKEKKGEKTFAIESFEGNNLVFVDEGHRGMSGAEEGLWLQQRNKLCAEGFSFEYSATFGQALKGNEALQQQYARCTLFDYSYKWFYTDGYGKQYRIYNLPNNEEGELKDHYLAAALLSFFQQLKLYQDKEAEFAPYLLAKPLWVFVGNSVNAVRTEKKKPVSDVLDVLLFLSRFIGNREQMQDLLGRLVSGNDALTDAQGHSLFNHTFGYLIKKKYAPAILYDEILKTLFNADAVAALHVSELKNADGEIAVSIGADNDPFAVINIGDTAKFRKLCEDYAGDLLVVEEREFADSLFQSINDKNSSVNLLIGSRKFTEGWNSWRVSSMGLMNMGKTEGAQVIQLFGRGVRLKGKDYCLKRTTALLGIAAPAHIDQVETLQIFGVKADYMAQFKAYLEEEGLPTADDREEIILPVTNLLGTQKLKTIKLQDGVDFKRQAEKPVLRPPLPDERIPKVNVDKYPQLQVLQARDMRQGEAVVKHEGKLTVQHIAFMDLDSIYFELQQLKNERAWFNLAIERTQVEQLLKNNDWYTLYIPPEQLDISKAGSFRQVRLWQEIAVSLLKKYAERFYTYKKSEWEKDKLEYRILTPDDPNFIEEYKLAIDKSCTEIIERINGLKEDMAQGVFKPLEFQGFKAIQFDRHLYKPLLHVNSSHVEIKPVALNQGEQQFVVDVQTYCKEHPEFFEDGRELYMLRNMSRGHGIGFFEAGNFYPDFILWILEGKTQRINFIDPKGLRNLQGTQDPKIAFYRTIKNLETRLGDPNVILNSFIISNTPYEQVSWWGDSMTLEEFNTHHVFFMENQPDYFHRILAKTQ